MLPAWPRALRARRVIDSSATKLSLTSCVSAELATFHLAVFIVMLRPQEIKHIDLSAPCLENLGGLGAEPPEIQSKEEILDSST